MRITGMRLAALIAVISCYSGGLSYAGYYPITQYFGQANSPIPVAELDYLEDFEDGVLNTPGVIFTPINVGSGVTPRGEIFVDSVDDDFGPIDGNGNSGRSLGFGTGSGPTSSAQFAFDAGVLGTLPTHAGVVWTDVGRESSGLWVYGRNQVTFEAFNELGVSLGTISSVVGDFATDGGTPEDRFFGVEYSGGISRIVMTIASHDWELDHLQYGGQVAPQEVPEPASAILALLGAVGGYGIKRRRAAANA
jgi:hypothetical protein